MSGSSSPKSNVQSFYSPPWIYNRVKSFPYIYKQVEILKASFISSLYFLYFLYSGTNRIDSKIIKKRRTKSIKKHKTFDNHDRIGTYSAATTNKQKARV